MHLIWFFWCNNYNEHTLRCFFDFPYNLSCSWDLSQRNSFQCNFWCFFLHHAKKFSSASLGRAGIFSMVTTLLLSISSFTNWADPSSLSRKPRPELCRNIGHSRSLFGRNPANPAPPPGWSQKIDHDNSWCERKACAFGLGMDPMATRMRCTLPSCLCLCRNLLVQVLLMSLKLRFSRIQNDTEIGRVLFESSCERTSIYQEIVAGMTLWELWCTWNPSRTSTIMNPLT